MLGLLATFHHVPPRYGANIEGKFGTVHPLDNEMQGTLGKLSFADFWYWHCWIWRYREI